MDKSKDLLPLDITTQEDTALSISSVTDLNQESKTLINQIISESSIDKTKDLTYLFNINQNKKTLVRIDKLSGLQDNLVDQFVKRLEQRPDEISNKELMDGLKVVQDIIERGQKQISGENTSPAPLIQINQQTNSVNVGESSGGLNRESREKVKNAVLSLLNNLSNTSETLMSPNLDEDSVIEAEVVENDI